jgi:hypothetical protein
MAVPKPARSQELRQFKDTTQQSNNKNMKTFEQQFVAE